MPQPFIKEIQFKFDKENFSKNFSDLDKNWKLEIDFETHKKVFKLNPKSKINNFRKNPKKVNYIYILTPEGVAAKTKLTINFMKRKMKEYDELKKEIKNLKN